MTQLVQPHAASHQLFHRCFDLPESSEAEYFLSSCKACMQVLPSHPSTGRPPGIPVMGKCVHVGPLGKPIKGVNRIP
ncbi:hypothetical protein DSO57_1011262 [Entomophthora muscae]|uniref:Uncharacterized protein n=1 Tax=Entomophthora muscae TaxID=34485 RepID=A0ACC2RX89_9FUNG|nr:hypothetical protein DSO57_1011262 [Entomophthora muscae]